METAKNFTPDVQATRELATAIDRWVAARKNATAVLSDENRHAYNATLFALGEAFVERYPEAVEMPEIFQWYRRGLIAPEADE
jgi:hypothetical protein